MRERFATSSSATSTALQASPTPSRAGATRSRTSCKWSSSRWPGPSLFRLARNTCIDHLRRQKLRRIFTPFAPEHENVPETDASVDSEELDALRHALGQLRPKDRALLALVQEGRSHAEIAESFNTSVAAVKARLHRAREQLRQHYNTDEN